MWFVVHTEEAGVWCKPLATRAPAAGPAESGPRARAGQSRAEQSKAEQSRAAKGPELNNAGLGSYLPRFLGTWVLHWMLSYVDERNEPYVLCLCHTLLGTARIPTECPLPPP